MALRKVNYPFIPLLPGPLEPVVLVLIWAPSMGQIELFNHLKMCKQMIFIKCNNSCYIGIYQTSKICANK